MAKQDRVITFTNGVAEPISLPTGVYSFVSSTIPGYTSSSIPDQTIDIATDTLNLNISGQGTLTVGVRDEDMQYVTSGTVMLTDASGQIPLTDVTDLVDGIAVFENLPYSESGSVVFYVHQLTTDEFHSIYPDAVQIIMDGNMKNSYIENLKI